MGLNSDINLSDFTSQFKDLTLNEPESWPKGPKITFCVVIFLAVLALGWQFYWSDKLDVLESKRNEETKLKGLYQNKLMQVNGLEALKKQKEEVTQRVAKLERQLPSKTEMDALLSDVNHAGVARGLQFELFRPQAAVVNPHYAEIPVAVKLQGSYHDIAQFAADVAALPRIVTLNNLSLVSGKDGSLTMESQAKAFRLLDDAEQQGELQKKAKAVKDAQAKGAKP